MSKETPILVSFEFGLKPITLQLEIVCISQRTASNIPTTIQYDEINPYPIHSANSAHTKDLESSQHRNRIYEYTLTFFSWVDWCALPAACFKLDSRWLLGECARYWQTPDAQRGNFHYVQPRAVAREFVDACNYTTTMWLSSAIAKCFLKTLNSLQTSRVLHLFERCAELFVMRSMCGDLRAVRSINGKMQWSYLTVHAQSS